MTPDRIISQAAQDFTERLPNAQTRGQFWATYSALTPDEKLGFDELADVPQVIHYLRSLSHIYCREFAVIGMSPLARAALRENPEFMEVFMVLVRTALTVDLRYHDRYKDNPEQWIRDYHRSIAGLYALQCCGDGLLDGITNPKGTTGFNNPSLYPAAVEIVRKAFDALQEDVREHAEKPPSFPEGFALRDDLQDLVRQL